MAKYSYEEVAEYFSKYDCVLINKEYKSNKAPLEYLCSCGNPKPSTTTFDKFKNRGQRCKKCGIEKRAEQRRRSYEYIRQVFEESGCILLAKDYINCDTPMEYICNCGNPNPCTITFDKFRVGQRCSKCAHEKAAEKRRLSYEHVQKIFEDSGCILLSEEYINNSTSMDYICECGEPSKIRFSNFQEGYRCKKCGIEKMSGENNPNYNPNLTIEERIVRRKYDEYPIWRNAVFTRDDYTCQCCGVKGGKIVAHHLNGYNWFVEGRTDINNGVTLCRTHHLEFHSIYGNGDNTHEQYEEWIQNKRNQDAI